MAHILVENQTKSIRELIHFVSTFEQNDIYIEELIIQGFDFEKKGSTLRVLCSDGICQLDLNHLFIDASSFKILAE